MRREINGWSIRVDTARAERARERGWWLDTTIAEAAAQLAQTDPGHVVVVDGVHRLTAADLYSRARRLAEAMRERGLKRGDVVSFMLPNWHEACVIYLATALAGLVANPLVTAYRNSELTFMLADCRSRMIFIPARFRRHDYVAMLGAVCRDLPTPPAVVVVRGEPGRFLSYDKLLAHEPATLPFDRVDPDSVRMVLYTSGTTGRPKGVLHTHNTLNAVVRQIHERWNCGSATRFFIPSPISHIGGSLYAFELPLLFKTTAVLLDNWDADVAVELIDRERCTHTAGATPFLQQILASAGARGTRLPSLEVFICGGASVPPSLIRAATRSFANCAVTRVYGSTEVPTITVGSMRPGDLAHAAETDGEIGYAELKIAQGPGGEGEICARGPQMLVGYLHAEDEADVFDTDGFFHTGDLGRLVDERFVVISGRKKDLIIRHGENISPKELEDILAVHPDIVEICVVGIPNERTGEMACAFVVPRAGAQPTVNSLSDYLSAQGVARYKFPERVELRSSMPRNVAGKILKHVLRAELLERDLV